jgi:hypothetical protein
MKRCLRNFTEPIAKRTRSNKPKLLSGLEYTKVEKDIPWISATKTRNFFYEDTLVDWLKVYGGRNRSASNNFKNNKTFNSFIQKKGIDFEKYIVNLIKEKFPVEHVSEIYNIQNVNKTIELIKKGVPIIHSAPLCDKRNKTYGVADLLVRNDYLNKIIDNDVIIEDCDKEHYYTVIDIKYCTLFLKCDGIHLQNSKKFRAYKSQILIYNQALGNIQGYTPRYAYILGRRWKYTSKKIKYFNDNCFNKLGVIDYNEVDKFIVNSTKFALKWERDVIKNGLNWSIYPPTKFELYPNMCTDSYSYNSKKRVLAKDLGEITMLWNCSPKNRLNAFNNEITSWKDPNCNSKILGIRGKRGDIIDKMIEVNREKYVVRPHKILNNDFDWKNGKVNELFVDFETFNDICQSFDTLPKQESFNIIYLIGVGWIDNGEWNYKKFICENPTKDNELVIMKNFISWVEQLGNPPLFCWHAEKGIWNRSVNDHKNHNLKKYEWVDMCKIFRKEPIIIGNCFNFGLKSIGKALQDNKLINVKLEADCSNGMTAMIRAWNCYQKYNNPIEAPLMRDVIKYNEYDVKVLWKIVEYLRINHC